MNNVVAATGAQLPVAIDYPAALALRQIPLVHDDLPKYLLVPEITALLHYVSDLHRKLLLATLWNSGARINEALALTRENFSLAPPYPFVQLATLKQRTEKATRSAGRLPAASTPPRVNRAKNTPEAKAIIRDYVDADSPQTVLALLEENERFRSLISDLLRDQTKG